MSFAEDVKMKSLITRRRTKGFGEPSWLLCYVSAVLYYTVPPIVRQDWNSALPIMP